jgi:glycogen(starch) synthase
MSRIFLSPDTVFTASPRIFFAAGPGNVIEAHNNWRKGVEDPSQMSITFSSEFEKFCREKGSPACIVSSGSPARSISDGAFVIEHRPKKAARGIWYHFGEIRYGLSLLATAVKFRADYAVIQSGSTHYFVLSVFRLFSIEVIPVLHNTLWPTGFRPKSFARRIVGKLDAAFFRWFATSTIGVSPECCRQVDEVTKGRHGPILEIRPQFDRKSFPLRPPPPNAVPFRLVYAGRITRDKGVFDLLEIMRQVEQEIPGAVTLRICGDGHELGPLQSECEQMRLGNLVEIKGRVEPDILRQILSESHAAIVPTRSEFAEGMAMTAIEPVLLGRPVITSPVVPALEILRDACLSAVTDDTSSYAAAIIALAQSRDLYERLVASCSTLREIFFDRGQSFQAALMKAIT